jgi:hypothetical protein
MLRRIVMVVILLGTPALAHAKTGVQMCPDGQRVLVSKDVGNERWAMMYDTQSHISCSGADSCPAEPCDSTDWHFISDVTLPGEFFMAPAAMGGPGMM